jgi:hypothetical protein
MEQLFGLQGEGMDLDELAHSFQRGPASVKKIGERYYLQLEIESGQTDEKAVEVAEAELTRMNAISLVRDEKFRRTTVAGISNRDEHTGELITLVRRKVDAQSRSSAHVKVTLKNAATGAILPESPSVSEEWLRTARGDPGLWHALEFYGALEGLDQPPQGARCHQRG